MPSGVSAVQVKSAVILLKHSKIFSDDEGSRPESEVFEGSEVYEEIESDMSALQILKPQIETGNPKSRPNSQHIEGWLF